MSTVQVGDRVRMRPKGNEGVVVSIIPAPYCNEVVVHSDDGRVWRGAEISCDVITPALPQPVTTSPPGSHVHINRSAPAQTIIIGGGGGGSGSAITATQLNATARQFSIGDHVVVGPNATQFKGMKGTVSSLVNGTRGGNEYRVDLNLGVGAKASVIFEEWELETDVSHAQRWMLGTYGGTSSQQAAAWKAEGKCEQCGTLLPMSIHGLGECPHHPKPLPPNHKQ